MSTDVERSGPGAASPEEGRTLLPTFVAWVALLASAGYAIFLHQGLAYPPGGWASEWWHPTQYLTLSPIVGGWAESPPKGTLIMTLPAMLLAVPVFLATRSSVLRAIALSLVALAASFAFYGLALEGIWEIFHWRLSLVMFWTALIIGFTLMSPALSAAWLRRGTALKLLLYVPVAFAVVALIRNATGTDETLFSNFSPWPAISVFGLEIGAYSIVGMLLGLSLALGGLSQLGKRNAAALAALLGGALLPAIWFHARFDTTRTGALVLIFLVSCVVIGFGAITRGGDRSRKLARRAGHLLLGAVLVIAPVFTGRAWANADYTVNKFVRAKIAQDALALYFEKNGVYPEKLSTLVEQGYLKQVPRPRVGFDFLYDWGFLPPIRFSYRGLGASYVLEFVSTEWVQCAYNPPWAPSEDEYDDEEYDDEEYANEDDESGEAWSCPDTRPALWGDDTGRPDEYDEYQDEAQGEEE